MNASTLASRSLLPEIMDDPALGDDEHLRALRGLRRINAISGTAWSIWRPITRLIEETNLQRVRILDVGCGGGDLVFALAATAARAGIDLDIAGCDMSTRAIDIARSRAETGCSGVHFFRLDALADPWPEEYDVVVSSLLLHHFRHDEIVGLLRRATAAARRMVVISDLRRTYAGLLLARIGTRVLSRSRVVHHDGPQSVRAALTMPELRQAAHEAGLHDAPITCSWPQRMLLVWRRG
jgi:2-polyprenyl-3-methyl-5-hydroxy-6-metoxy-1,4-benzoquinol methylase